MATLKASARNPVCPSCNEKTVRLDAYDAYACQPCDMWYSKPCSGQDCLYCEQLRKLPKPSDAPVEVWTDPWNT